MNVAEYVVEQLAAWGVRYIYGLVGDTLFPLMDAIARHPRLRFVAVRHEAAAGFMASAEAKLTGRLGVCLATSGPGIASLMNGLGDAYADRAPVLAITGQVATRQIGTDAKQYVDQQSLIRPLASYTALLTHPDAAGQMLPAAMRTAIGEGRVAHLSIPKDLFPMPCGATIAPAEPFLGAPPTPDPAAIDEALALMAKAERPLMLLGLGARPAGEELQALAERAQAGIILSQPAKGCIAGSHPLVLGGLGESGSDAGHRALQEADLLLTVGCNWWPKAYVPNRLATIKVDRLPTNIGGRMPVRCGIAGDVRAVIPQLLSGIGEAEARTAWLERLGALKRAWEARVDQEALPTGPILSPQAVVRAMEKGLPPDAIIALDTGDHTIWFNRIFAGERHEVLSSGSWRSLGFGLPAALAAKLAQPERTVVALVGDTGLQSLLGELVTAAELGLPVAIILINNGMMAIEHNKAVAQGLHPLGTTPRNPDFAALATACGLAATAVRTPSELAHALQAALAARGPYLVEVMASAPAAPAAKA